MISLPFVREKILENLRAELTYVAPANPFRRHTRTTFHCKLKGRPRLIELLSMTERVFPLYENGTGPYPPTKRATRRTSRLCEHVGRSGGLFHCVHAQNGEVGITMEFVCKCLPNGLWFVQVVCTQRKLRMSLRDTAAATISRIFQTVHPS